MATIKKAAPKKAAPKKSNLKGAKPTPSKSISAKAHPTPVFNIDEINELLKAVNHSNVNELKLEKGDFKITIRQGAIITSQMLQTSAAANAQAHAPAALSTPSFPASVIPASSESVSDNLITIKSPMIGTFYRSAGPDKAPFVTVGDEIRVGQVLCIVEAMKLFNEIESEVSGKIVKVLADDTSPVEYDQPLFLIEP